MILQLKSLKARYWVLWLILCSTAAYTHAQQNNSQIEAANQPNSPATSGRLGNPENLKSFPDLYPGEVSDFGVQHVIEEKKHRKWIELNLDWQAGYTDNYLLTNVIGPTIAGGKPQTTQMTSTWDLAFAPDVFEYEGFKLAPKVGFRQAFWNYGIGTGQNSNFAAFDFDTQTVYGETKAFFEDDWTVTLGADWTRINSWGSQSEIYRQYGPRWEASKLIKLNDYNAFNISVDQQYLLTDVPTLNGFIVLGPDIYDRFVSTLTASYICSPIDHFFLTPYYRFTHAYYLNYALAGFGQQTQEERNDFTNTVGLIASYQINDYITARIFVSYEKRTTTYSDPTNDPTNVNVPEYSKFDTGIGGAFNIRF